MRLASSGYEHDIRLEHKFAKQLKAILGMQFFVQDSGEDWKRGTDFVVWGLSPTKVACRLRTHDFFLKYPNDFTIRWSRPNGIETEIHKIRKGLVDYLLYGFVDPAETHLVSYFIGNLAVFRNAQVKPSAIRTNDPPDSQLAAYRLDQLPSEFIVKRWPDSGGYTRKGVDDARP